MNKITSMTGLIILLFAPILLNAQPIEMADTMRSEGKIYVVVAILLVIFVGLIGYLVFLDRKITRIEKKLPEKKS
ncbi:MAG TPA: CcmD family protein [Cyclobacteriaceae bacterium]|nr:CcmD family protein [Cyclobacteriaceae bacterium]HPW61498.1 CcmD family protein [Cyclobacteriaceae bacterium]